MSENQISREFLLDNPLPLPQGEVDKDARGRVAVIGSHKDIPGAVLLAGEAALRSGAGKLQILTVQTTSTAIGIAVPEARVTGLSETSSGDIDPSNAQTIVESVQGDKALLIGPGMLDDAVAGFLASTLLSQLEEASFVLDAAALTGLRLHPQALKGRAGRTVITPHAGEMATFLNMDRDDVQQDPVGAARSAASLTGSVVVMKGRHTHIASPQGEIWSSGHGNVGLATSGSGDTLAGIIAGLLARGAPPLLAAQWGVFIHGEAGNRLMKQFGLLGYLAREIPAQVPAIMMDVPQTS